MLLYALFFISLISKISGEGSCPVGQIESACVNDCGENTRCVDLMALLVGGSNLAGWRNDAELINDKNFTKKIADFPYTIDAPYGFWSGPTGGVVVCGGKNWDEDITETRCWRYLHCTDTWTQLYTDLPVPSSGGVGVPVQYSSGEWGLWIIGGGNGVDAINNVQILSTEGENLVWSEGPRLINSRYGHCAFLNPVTKQIHVFGGRDNQNILKSMEILNIEADISQVVEDWNLAENRWGALCQTYQDSQGQIKVGLMGGMDSFFIPHNNFYTMDIGIDGEVSLPVPGPTLPWSSAGPIGVAFQGKPTLVGGFSLAGYKHRITSLEKDSWFTWSSDISSSRVSGLAVALPDDIFLYC